MSTTAKFKFVILCTVIAYIEVHVETNIRTVLFLSDDFGNLTTEGMHKTIVLLNDWICYFHYVSHCQIFTAKDLY